MGEPSLREEALAYLAKGYSIIPLRARKKIPLIQWTEYQRRLPTKQEVEKWWRDWPDANIGLITGRISGVVVVDVDIKHKGDPKKIRDESPTGLIQKTGSGGYHFFYSYPDDADHVANATSIRQGVDIRADGGYVVVPPSVHESGNKYQWISVGAMAPTPDWVLGTPKTSAQVRSDTVSTHEPWVAALLSSGSAVGERNDNLARLTGYFAAKRIPVDVARALLRGWNERNAEPLPTAEVDTTIYSIYKTEAEKKPPKNQKKVTQLNILTARDFVKQYGDLAVKWTIEGWLPDSTVGFMVSPPGGFKTWLLLDCAVSVASGRDFLGLYKVSDPGPVLIFQQEDHRADLARRLQTIYLSRAGIPYPSSDGELFQFQGLPPDLPIWIHPDREFSLEDPSAIDELDRIISQIRPKLVLMDPLYAMTDSDEFMAKTASKLLFLKEMRDTYGTSFMVAHHTRKSPGESQRGEMWGSQFLNAWLETGWQLRRDDETVPRISLRRHFKAAGPVAESYFEFHIETGSHWSYKVTETAKKSEEETAKEIAESGGPRTAGEIAKQFGWHRQKATRYLEKLKKAGLARLHPDGKWEIKGKPQEDPQLTLDDQT